MLSRFLLRRAALQNVRRLCTSETPTSTVDASEVAKFASQASKWWHPNGSAAPLHRLNPARVAYIRSAIERNVLPNRSLPSEQPAALRPLAGIDVVDVGCGGGLVTEPIARLGANVLGIDKSKEGIQVARYHAQKDRALVSSNLLHYREAAVEDVTDTYDVVLALEIIEHVAEPDAFIRHCAARVRHGGVLILSTLNRTVASYAFGIVAAERVLGWLPRGTHDWTRFPTPEEVADVIDRQTPLTTSEVVGVAFNPLRGNFSIVKDTSVNYMLTAVRPISKQTEANDTESPTGHSETSEKRAQPE